MLWVDKHRPRMLDKLIINTDIGDHLKKLVESGDCPHLLFYGSPGVGKHTLITCLLREMFGAGAEKLRVETRPWKIELPSRMLEVELTTVSSNYHVQINPSDVGNNDRYVVQEIIKDMARSRPVDPKGRKGVKVLVLTEVDRLSKEAQHSLRRTMEKYSAACRLVLYCNNVSKVIDPVRSRCLCIRVAAPTHEAVVTVLQAVAKKEHVALPDELASRIAQQSGRNLRRAILALECCRCQQYPLSADQEVQAPDWELYIQEIARDVLTEQSPKQLLLVRGKMYELLANLIPPELIIRRLTTELLHKVDDELKHTFVQAAAQYEHRVQEGAKAIFHIEAFVATCMAVYKQWSIMAFG